MLLHFLFPNNLLRINISVCASHGLATTYRSNYGAGECLVLPTSPPYGLMQQFKVHIFVSTEHIQ
ncbi:hypothetical protein C5167_039314 [Papaver somniferum]|uniref:Uncharacterized protein n=1 Tax=Papaver somniferum TaxID=3469 RepID=A0A4Y7IBR7_PAPSO|nr:hypothetical protein C5167_039314 [Papaver somniferum]